MIQLSSQLYEAERRGDSLNNTFDHITAVTASKQTPHHFTSVQTKMSLDSFVGVLLEDEGQWQENNEPNHPKEEKKRQERCNQISMPVEIAHKEEEEGQLFIKEMNLMKRKT